jgi:hypothetical protein
VFPYLMIDGDPTIWGVAQGAETSLTSQPDGTVSIEVISPLAGLLLLSSKSATVVSFTLGDGGDVIPSENKFATPVIYLPSPAGLTDGSPVYALPSATNLTTLADQITAAMRAGKSVTIDYGGPVARGVLTLNGATLSFVVLCPLAPGGGPAKVVPDGMVIPKA